VFNSGCILHLRTGFGQSKKSRKTKANILLKKKKSNRATPGVNPIKEV